MIRPNLFQRARELAESGQCTRLEHVERRLTREGYESVFHHLQGSLLRRELNQLIRLSAQAQRGSAESARRPAGGSP